MASENKAMIILAVVLAGGLGAIVAGTGLVNAIAPRDPDDVMICEEGVKALLRSPSTYKRIDITRLNQPKYSLVMISYDAANAYGTPIRDTAHCEFPPGTSPTTIRPELSGLSMSGRHLEEGSLDFLLAKSRGELAALKR